VTPSDSPGQKLGVGVNSA